MEARQLALRVQTLNHWTTSGVEVSREVPTYFIFDLSGSSWLHRLCSSCSERGPLFVVMRGLLIEVPSLVGSSGSSGMDFSSCEGCGV